MRKNNAGFTLMELLVSISILGILIVAAFGFMVSGSNIFKSVETRKNLRMEAQLAANLIESYIIDCNENIYFNSNRLFVINREGGVYSAHVFEFESDDNTLNYAKASVSKNSVGGYSYSSYDTDNFICGNVELFSVTIQSSESGIASFAELEIHLDKSGVSQEITKTIALRNKVTTGLVNQ